MFDESDSQTRVLCSLSGFSVGSCKVRTSFFLLAFSFLPTCRDVVPSSSQLWHTLRLPALLLRARCAHHVLLEHLLVFVPLRACLGVAVGIQFISWLWVSSTNVNIHSHALHLRGVSHHDEVICVILGHMTFSMSMRWLSSILSWWSDAFSAKISLGVLAEMIHVEYATFQTGSVSCVRTGLRLHGTHISLA